MLAELDAPSRECSLFLLLMPPMDDCQMLKGLCNNTADMATVERKRCPMIVISLTLDEPYPICNRQAGLLTSHILGELSETKSRSGSSVALFR